MGAWHLRLLAVTFLQLVTLTLADVMAHCSNPVPPRNGTIRETRDRMGNKMVQFTCDEGYILVGSNVLTCDGNGWNGSSPQCEVTDCHTHYMSGARVNGLYEIVPDGQHPMIVLCDMTTAGGGWTVFQQRLNNFTSFYRDWKNYKDGFKDDKGNLWLGLDALFFLTWNESELYVEMEGEPGNIVFARYSMFQVGSELDHYRLTVRGYSGTAGDSMTYHSGMRFSTHDKDNDENSGNCARRYLGAWWHKSCYYSNLNGLFLNGSYSDKQGPVGMDWYHYKSSHYYSMKQSKMMLR